MNELHRTMVMQPRPAEHSVQPCNSAAASGERHDQIIRAGGCVVYELRHNFRQNIRESADVLLRYPIGIRELIEVVFRRGLLREQEVAGSNPVAPTVKTFFTVS
jgi:hypothetical protein